MGWARDAAKALASGTAVEVQPRGRSMVGVIEDGQTVWLEPLTSDAIEPGDVLFVRWKGNYLLHIAAETGPHEILLRNAYGKINGWAPRADVLGRARGIRAETRGEG